MKSVERLDKSSDNGDSRIEDKKNRISMEIFGRKYHKWDLVTNLTIYNIGKVSQE